ncbi:MAG: Signal transduction histidine kinase containing PAS domain [Candidatus Methanohalarchaeum thermophilum]|uniref:histidine kinase n=1 Tax=Methanohalarchaeum thermophilum TaxID=1903181 RepID=A0A1Q6DWH3_METT1|nr:MAG: Signal transduction histidine kinase containing PAS domain [Candidatus Methanohalarchaeum thermophilum]
MLSLVFVFLLPNGLAIPFLFSFVAIGLFNFVSYLKLKNIGCIDVIDTLLVDDDLGFLDLAEDYLEREDGSFVVRTQSSSERALEQIESNSFDCIVSDYYLPELSGLELLKSVRKDLNEDIPFIMFTGKGGEEVAMEALNNGADRYITKEDDLREQFELLSDLIQQTVNRYRVKKRFKLAFEEMNEGLALHEIVYDETGDPVDYEILDVNPRFYEITSIKREDAVGKKATQVYRTDEAPYLDKYLKVAETGEPIQFETYYSPLDKYFKISVFSIRKGEFGTIFEDITEKKKYEKELERTKKEYKELINGMNDTTWVISTDGDFLEVNEAAREKLGYSKEKLLSLGLNAIDAYLDTEKINELIENLQEDEAQVFETVHEAKDGTKIPVEINSSLITYRGEEAILSIARDISKRKQAEKRRKIYASSLDQASLEVYWVKPSGKFAYANQKVRNKLGYTNKELRDMHVRDIDPNYGKKDRKEVWNKLKEKETITFESEHQKKDGQIYPVEITSYYVQIGEQEYEFSFAKDITEMKKAREREDLLHSLLRHDVQNKNQLIIGYLELLEEDLNESNEYLKKAKQACETSKYIIEKVRYLREAKKEETEEINLEPVLKEILEKNRPKTQENSFKLIKNFNIENCEIKAGRLLKELFNNLIENAIKHSNGTKIRINAKEKEEEDNYCLITIEDDGGGIPSEIKQEVFERGYKFGDSGETGLGLYIVKEIAESYDGKVEAKDSELGGARFDVTLQKL